jgi:non-canonical (house-cleaning) NTP pyrophosphatase
MEKYKIIVGTTSEPKVKYLKEVLKELKIQAQIFPVQVQSGVSEQPNTTEETERGSINRAARLVEKVSNADFSIGIEVGYHRNKNAEYEMFCWVTIIGKDGYQISSQSHKFLMPKYYQEILEKDLPVNEHLDGFLKNKKGSSVIKKYIDEIVRHRKPFIENALKNALLRYLNREDF